MTIKAGSRIGEKSGFVVAVSQDEANGIALDRQDLIHKSLRSAQDHLAEVKAPPTDPYYAAQYRIYVVNRDGESA